MSHLTTVGFHIENDEELKDLLGNAYEKGVPVEAENGLYVHFVDASGAELWIQVNQEKELVGLNPHFSGKARIKVGLVNVEEAEDDPMDGGYYAWANPRDLESEEEKGDYPFVFDVPDFYTTNYKELPQIREVQIAAFAQNIDCFESEEEFFAAQPEDIQMASSSFIPIGLFEQEEGDMPSSFGLINGHVLEVAEKQNELTGQSFLWLLVETLGGTMDLVCSLEVLNDQVVEKGYVIHSVAWLSGRLV